MGYSLASLDATTVIAAKNLTSTFSSHVVWLIPCGYGFSGLTNLPHLSLFLQELNGVLSLVLEMSLEENVRL